MKKTAIVTGSSRGIGFAIARQLGLDGYNIVMVATGPQEKNQAAVDALQKQGVCCAYVQANARRRLSPMPSRSVRRKRKSRKSSPASA